MWIRGQEFPARASAAIDTFFQAIETQGTGSNSSLIGLL